MAADFSGVLFYLRAKLGTQEMGLQHFEDNIHKILWGWLPLPVWNTVVNVG